MTNKNNNEQPRRRFREAVDGPVVMRLYATMPTEELAAMLGLTVKQITNYVYRKSPQWWTRKDPSLLSKENSKNGKSGGRPPKK